ncbi:MAG: type II secretion system F domain-containing protein [Puniceicoccaceae bacterium 5H]|nr:MAG: type II secretion system F domain-containing protein [Puniceicoccaceae bacterium 5H]
MPLFSYKAIDSGGRSQTGQLEAADRRSLISKLQARQLRPLNVSVVQQPGKAVQQTPDEVAAELDFFEGDRKQSIFKRTNSQQLGLEFCKRLLVLLQAGMPPGDAVRLLSQRVTDPKLKELCHAVWRELSEGRTLAYSLTQQTHLFNPATLHLIEAGEASGNLAPVLERTVAYLEERNEIQKDLGAKIAYPAFIVVMAITVLLILVLYLIPKIEGMLDKLGGELPLITKVMLSGTDFLTHWGWLVALLAVAVGFGVAAFRRSAKGRWSTDLLLLRLPLFGKIALYNTVYTVTHLLGTLLRSGVNTTEALRLVEKVIGNGVMRAKFTVARRQIQEGVSLATAFDRVHFMPDVAMDILKVGENTGDVVNSLQDINRIYREELSAKLRQLTTITAAVALGGAIAMVAAIASAVVLSVLSMSQSLSM